MRSILRCDASLLRLSSSVNRDELREERMGTPPLVLQFELRPQFDAKVPCVLWLAPNTVIFARRSS